MSSRRTRLARTKHRMAASHFEVLETRRLLTTLSGGESFIYQDSNDNLFRIKLDGNVTAEFVSAVVNENTNLVRLVDLLPQQPEDSDLTGRDLFAVYVTRADALASISIVQVDDEGAPTPGGAAQEITLRAGVDGEALTVGGGAFGAGYLGARTVDTPAEIEDEENRPIVFGRLPDTGIGVLPPQPNSVMGPGVYVANGQNLGGFSFDGTITGRVSATGSLGTFHAGQLFTGQTAGQGIGPPQRPRNFSVNGDLRNLIVNGPIGTADDEAEQGGLIYYTGFDLQVRGVAGQIRSGSHITGVIDVRNALGGPFMTGAQQETELLGAGTVFANNTFDTPQYVSAYSDPAFGGAKAVRIVGTVAGPADPADEEAVGDSADFYAVPLMAGQTVTVQIVSPSGPGIAPTVTVWDPDQRVIASNENQLDFTQTLTSAFSFTADRPGLYRFAVGNISDPDDEGGEEGEEQAVPNAPSFYGDYSLRLIGVGDIGLGAVVAGGNYLSVAPASGITVYRGDFGALVAGGSVLTSPESAMDTNGTIRAPFSSIRVVEGGSIGQVGQQGGATFGLDLEVPSGHVGLVRSTTGELVMTHDGVEADSVVAGSYQAIDAAGTLYGLIVANGGVGSIRAGDMGTASPTVINVNYDNRGGDGIIDLIDVTGDLGSPLGGGPHITTNIGGNVRYMRVGGEIYRDTLFGQGLGTAANTIIRAPGQDATITDDSGALINIRPRLIPNPRWNPSDPTSPRYLGRPPTFAVTTYPIRGSGGSVITNIDTDRTIVVTAQVQGTARNAEIGRINLTESGAPVIFGRQPAVGNTPGFISDRLVLGATPTTLDISVFVNGPIPVDILEINGSGALNTVQNTTGGEMPIIRATSIGDLYGSNLGIARPRSTAAAVNPIEVLIDTFPFQSQRIGIFAQDIVNIAATEQLGNIVVQQGQGGGGGGGGGGGAAAAASGTIGSLVANSDGIDVGIFEGIVGPVLANDLRYVDIGDGLAASGSGNAQHSGLFANVRDSAVTQVTAPGYFPLGGRIESIRNRGAGDIRGTVAAEGRIQSIRLTNGSLIGAIVGVYTSIDQARRLQGAVVIPDDGDSFAAPIYDINEVLIEGNGGIIGTFIEAGDIDLVQVRDGFGIFTSEIGTLGDGRVNRVVAGGYGIRNTFIGDGAAVTEINATGNGSHVNSAFISPSVRLSEGSYPIDPFFGHAPNELTDIHLVLGTTAQNRFIDNVTNSGIIDGLMTNGSVDLGALYADRLRNSMFAFANAINLIQTRGPMRNLQIITGRLNKLQSGSDVAQIVTSISGPIGDFYIDGNVDEMSDIRAIGPGGRIGRFQTNGFLGGDITTTGVINQLTVGRDVLATSRVEADDIVVRQIGGAVFGQIVIV